jgi:hypothetical protein
MLAGTIPSLGLSVAGTVRYQTARSLRFWSQGDSLDPWRLRMPAAPPRTSSTVFTVSFWTKRSNRWAPTFCSIFSGYDGSSAYSALIGFNPAGQFRAGTGGASGYYTTTATFGSGADVTNWTHFVVSYDTASGTPVKVYANNVAQTLTPTAVGTVPHLFMYPGASNRIGAVWGDAVSGYGYDGYIADFIFVDGKALTPAAFGEIDPRTSKWAPKKYTGTYGSAGFYLDFADNSSQAALGTDRSGMSNLLPVSDAFNAAPWAQGGGAVGTLTGGQPDPYGGTGAFKYTVAAGNPNPYCYQSVSYPVGQHTATIYIKAVSLSAGSWFNLYNGNGNGATAGFDFSGSPPNTNLVGTGSGASAVMTDVGNGWYKCSLTVTHNTATVDNFIFQPVSSTVGDAIYVFRADLTNGATIPTELQYTNGAAVPNKNWTPVNFRVPSTAAIPWQNDSVVDSPSNYGTDTGLGGEVRGNYGLFNTADSNGLRGAWGNMYADNAGAVTTWRMMRASQPVPVSGHWWTEFYANSNAGYIFVGTYDPTAALSTYPGAAGSGVKSVGYLSNGSYYVNGSNPPGGPTWTTGDYVAVRIFMGIVQFYKLVGGVWQALSVVQTGLTGNICMATALYDADTVFINCGQQPWRAPPPAGAKAICSQNVLLFP